MQRNTGLNEMQRNRGLNEVQRNTGLDEMQRNRELDEMQRNRGLEKEKENERTFSLKINDGMINVEDIVADIPEEKVDPIEEDMPAILTVPKDLSGYVLVSNQRQV